MEWTWKDREQEVDVPDAGRWSWRKPGYGELRAFEYALERAAKVYEMLETARANFEGARGRYENACDEARHLIDESNKAAVELIGACRDGLERFFSPDADGRAIHAAFEGKGNDLVRFSREWIGRQGHPPDVVKNSSRAHGAKSCRAPRKTAPSASGSSSMETGSPHVSGPLPPNGSRTKTAGGARSS